MTNQNRLLINNCYQITYFLKINRQIYSAPPPSAISSALFTKNPRHLIRIPEILSLAPLPATKTSFSKPNRRTFVCLLKAFYGAHLVSAPQCRSPARHCSRNFNEKHLWMRLSKPVFHPKSCRFHVPKMSLKNANGCSVCAWLLTSGGLRPAMRLRRIAALALRHQPKPLKGPPRLSFRLRPRAGADQAHTLSQTNQPLNRPIPSHKRERATLPRRTTKSAAGSGAVPADPLGIGCRSSPPLALSFCAFRFLTFPCFLFFRIMLFPSEFCFFGRLW